MYKTVHNLYKWNAVSSPSKVKKYGENFRLYVIYKPGLTQLYTTLIFGPSFSSDAPANVKFKSR